jgi:NAD(P)-dependent dehydrogenase (short-subunit alcohol dehydrogenase family)
VALGYGTKGVRCNLVAPGSIRTPTWDDRLKSDPKLLERLTKWYPLARIGAPDDVANAVLFLASDEASWITGTCLTVDGGLLAGNVGMRADVLNTWDPT